MNAKPGCDSDGRTQLSTQVGHPNPACGFSWVNPRAKLLRLSRGSPHFPTAAAGAISHTRTLLLGSTRELAGRRSLERLGDWQSLPSRSRRPAPAWELVRPARLVVARQPTRGWLVNDHERRKAVEP